MRKIFLRILPVTICLTVFSGLYGCKNRDLHKNTQVFMGTFVEVVSPDKNASGIVFDEISRIDNLLSKYKEESEVGKLNRLGKLKVSPDTLYILQKAKEFWQLTGGAFDITIGPLVDLWGFTDKKYCVPEKAEIQKALKLVGSDKIIFNINDSMVEFKLRGMKIDLGAIAKGYAVDCAVAKLKERGIKSCLINAGGQIYCLGDNSGKPWNIAVREPRSKNFWNYLKLKDRAVATSGDYEQYFTEGNIRYCHIFNPKTGCPSDSGVISVTVVAPDGLTADALATSVFILGREKGIELTKKFKDVELEIIEQKDVQDNQ